ncbi:iron ABC transporter permease [Paenibacillus sp. IB182496]|uniref:Iron ABC transporter permease n=2 Tax=Paenibacillus sabuli TaxID=2772509 RepID=A0A927BQM0_9BACL|nr:iron ABC transporter permease [Paenibacillus sabuli]
MRLLKWLSPAARHSVGWLAASVLGGAAVLLPLLYVLIALLRPLPERWESVRNYLLTDYIAGTVQLVALTTLPAVLLGVGVAWLTSAYAFPLARLFRWALVLPLAIPPYIGAFTYSTMTSYTGFIRAGLRNHLGIQLPPGLIDVMSLRGAAFTLTLFLFPYVFLLTKAFLQRQSAAYIENARLLGHSGWRLLARTVLPLGRPAIAAGGMLVVFEVLSDYGVASFFGVQTLSTAIFQTWFGMYDVDAAIRLAAWLLLIVVGLIVAERALRARRRYHAASGARPLSPMRLRGAAAWGATALCALVLTAGFLLPFGQLVYWAARSYAKVWRADFGELLLNSLTGAALATLPILALALLIARSVRLLPGTAGALLSRSAASGYAVPGAIVAIGVLAVCIGLDRLLAPWYARLGRGEDALVISLSLGMLLFGYMVRFLAIGYNALESGYTRIPHGYAEAARTLGLRPLAAFVRVELPLLRGSLVTAAALAFIEIVKELPLTLLLRPFNFTTLATRTYQYAIDERIYEAATPAVLLIAVSLLSVLLVLRLEERKEHTK